MHNSKIINLVQNGSYNQWQSINDTISSFGSLNTQSYSIRHILNFVTKLDKTGETTFYYDHQNIVINLSTYQMGANSTIYLQKNTAHDETSIKEIY